MSVTGKKRQGNDKFYTNSDIALDCFNTFKKYITHKDCVIIEPAAGNGAFLGPLADYNYKAYDILPENEGIILQDFLTLDLAQFQTPLYFIGNPPFGRQSSLAKKFIKHITACVNTAVIGFILPKSFKKESMQKCFPLHYWCAKQIDLPDNSFNIDGNIHNVPCVFQIWEKRAVPRVISPTPKSLYFDFVKITEQPDFSLRRVGVYAGKLDKDVAKSQQSHCFIKLKQSVEVDDFARAFKGVVFSHDNTVGPRSISKKEFIVAINQMSI